MANILKEYQEIVNPSANMGLKGVSVLLNIGVGAVDMRYIPVSELYIKQNDSATKQVGNVSELLKRLNEGRLYWSKTDMPIDARVNTHDIGFFKKNFDLPEQYITDQYQGDKAVAKGLTRVLEVKQTRDFSGEYLYCQTLDDSRDFYHKSDIGYIENGVIISLDGKTREEVEEILEKKVLYVISTNQQVAAIYTDSSYTFGKVLKTESVDLENMTKTVFEYDKHGEVVEKQEKVDDRYSEQVFRKDGDEAYLDTYNYVVSQSYQAKYVRVRYEGETVESLIDIGAAYYLSPNGTLGKAVDPAEFRGDDRFRHIGKKLAVKLRGENGEEVIRITEPLTLDQVASVFERLKCMNETTSEQDILADNTYVRLADGRYMKEKAVAKPICYDFVTDPGAEFDAYFVEVGATPGEKTVIVSKAEFDKQKSVTWQHGSITIDKRRAYKVARTTKEMKYADVVQISKQNKGVEECISLADPSYVDGRVVLDRLDNVDEQCDYCQGVFETRYKKGQYKIDKVLDENGKWVNVDSRGKRYKFEDHVSMHDYSNDRSEYAYFKDCKYEYDGKRLVGGKPYDVKKGIKGDMKKLRANATKLLTFAFSGAGIIFFPVTAAIFVYLPARAIYIPIKHWAHKMKFDHTSAKYQGKLGIQRKQIKKDIEKELEFLYANTVKASNENRLNKNNMLDRFESVEQMIYSLAETKFLADFRMVKGKGRVTESNAELFSKYRADMTALEKEIKKLERAVKRDPSLAPELQAKQRLHAEKIKSYISQGVIEPKDPKFRDLLNRSNIMKGYLLERFYGEELSEQQKSELDQMYALYVKSGDKMLNPSKLQTLLRQPDKLAHIRALASECMKKGRISHYNYNDNLLGKQGYSTNGLEDYRAEAVDEVNKTAETYVPVEHEAKDDVILLPAADPKTLKGVRHKAAREKKLQELVERDRMLADDKGEVIALGGATVEKVSSDLPIFGNEDVPTLTPLDLSPEGFAVDSSNATPNVQTNVPVDPAAPAEPKNKSKVKKQPKAYDPKIVSEDRLIVLLKANPESKDRKKLMKYITENAETKITEQDVQRAIDRITEMHKEGVDATTGSRGKVSKILKLGQEYLTKFAKDKKFLVNPDDGMTV